MERSICIKGVCRKGRKKRIILKEEDEKERVEGKIYNQKNTTGLFKLEEVIIRLGK